MKRINLKNFSLFLIILLPFAIILGQAPSDIIVSSVSILFLTNSIIHKDWSWLKIKWIKIVFLLWLYLIFASFFSLDKEISFSHSILFVRFFIFAVALEYWVLSEKRNLNYVLYSLGLAFLIVSLDTFYQFLNFDLSKGYGPDFFGFYSNDHFRLTGPFRSNIPGAYMSKFFFIILLFSFIKSKKFGKNNFVFISLITSIFYLVFLTGEAMSFASMGLGIFVLFLLEKKLRKQIIFSTSIVFILILFTIKFNPVWKKIEIVETNPWHNGTIYEVRIPCDDDASKLCKKTYKTQPFFYEVLTNFSKTAYWETYNQAFLIWKDFPLFGIGIKNYTNACNLSKYKENLKKFFCTTHPHNFYIQWLVETGVFGFIGFIFLVVSWFNHFMRFALKRLDPLLYGPILSLFVLFWPIMSTGSFFSNRNATMNWFVMALCLSIIQLKKKV